MATDRKWIEDHWPATMQLHIAIVDTTRWTKLNYQVIMLCNNWHLLCVCVISVSTLDGHRLLEDRCVHLHICHLSFDVYCCCRRRHFKVQSSCDYCVRKTVVNFTIVFSCIIDPFSWKLITIVCPAIMWHHNTTTLFSLVRVSSFFSLLLIYINNYEIREWWWTFELNSICLNQSNCSSVTLEKKI